MKPEAEPQLPMKNIPGGLLDVQPVLHDHVEEVNVFPRKINCCDAFDFRHTHHDF